MKTFKDIDSYIGEQAIDVKERLDREMLINMNMHGSTTILLKRANKVFPIIEPILAKNGIPDDFKYLAVIESGLINAISPSGAKGVWQFMPETAKESKLEVTEQVDERYHIEKATQAACDYLLKAKNKSNLTSFFSKFDILTRFFLFSLAN